MIAILSMIAIIMKLVTSVVFTKDLHEEVNLKAWESENIIKETGIFKTSEKHSDTQYNESYIIDYSCFFQSNTCFNEDLCHMAAIWSGLAYEDYSFNGESLEEILARYMDGYKYIDIQCSESDIHEVHMYISHKLVQSIYI